MEDFFNSEEWADFKKSVMLSNLASGNIHCHAPFKATRLLGDTIGVCHNHHDNYTDREKLQKEMISGELNEKCRYCEVKSKYTGNEFLEVILGNNCNNNCKICLPLYSKNIFTIENIENPIGELKLSENLLSHVNEIGDTIKEIEFIGGETFLYSKQIISILKKCKNVKKIYMVTNGSVYDEEVLNYISDNKITLSLFISIDGTPSTQSYMRGFSDYETVIQNIKKYESRNINCCINVAVSILNALDLSSIVSNIQYRVDTSISTTMVHTPIHYSLSYVQDDNLRKNILTEFEKIRYNSCVVNKESLISFMETEKHVVENIRDFKKHTLKMLKTHDDMIKMDSSNYINVEMYDYLRR